MVNEEYSYVLTGNKSFEDARAEYERLQFQNSLPQYSIDNLLSKSDLNFLVKSDEILDLGFGGGYLSKWLLRNISCENIYINAVDNYSELLNYSLSKLKENDLRHINKINESFVELKQIDDSSQAGAFTRFTVQHLPRQIDQYFKKVFEKLKPSGTFWIIDGDGVSANLQTDDPHFNQEIINLSYNIENYHPQISQFITRRLIRAGFEVSDIRMNTELFKTEDDLLNEHSVWEKRFSLLGPVLLSYFGSQKKAEDYKRRYLEAILEKGRIMYFNHFAIKATKPEVAH